MGDNSLWRSDTFHATATVSIVNIKILIIAALTI